MALELTSFHANYFANELTKRSPSDSVQKLVTSLMDAQVDLNPHHVETFLFACRSPLSYCTLQGLSNKSGDIVNNQKEDFPKIKARLQQTISLETLFTLKWQII